MGYLQAVGGIVQGAGDIFSGIVDLYNAPKEREAIAAAQKEAKGMWQQQRRDWMGQNIIENQLNQDQLKVAQGGLALNKEQFGLTKKQDKRTQLVESLRTLQDAAIRDINFRNYLKSSRS